jgi:hypothetical protein
MGCGATDDDDDDDEWDLLNKLLNIVFLTSDTVILSSDEARCCLYTLIWARLKNNFVDFHSDILLKELRKIEKLSWNNRYS